MGSLVENEEKTLEKFREYTKDLHQDDLTLLRFLKARNLDVKKADEQLRKYLQWRTEYKIDSLKEYEPPILVKEGLTKYFSGFDNHGVPVYISKLGNYDIRPLLAQGLLEDCLKYEGKCLEIAMELAKKNNVAQIVAIVDCAGLTFGKAAHWGSMQFVLTVMQDFEANYPEVLKRAIIFNCPSVFWYGYNMVKCFLSNHTISKLSIFDTDETKWKPGLVEHIPVQSIPEEYGGTARAIKVVD